MVCGRSICEVLGLAHPQERLAVMAPSLPWSKPPWVFVDPEQGSVAAGEESVEVHEQAVRAQRLPAANYPSGDSPASSRGRGTEPLLEP